MVAGDLILLLEPHSALTIHGDRLPSFLRGCHPPRVDALSLSIVAVASLEAVAAVPPVDLSDSTGWFSHLDP